MKPAPVRVAGAAVGVAVAGAAGWIVQGWWWLAAVVAAVGAIGAVSERQLTHLQVLGALALAGGAVATDQRWVIPLLAGGVVASVELLASADRVTVARPRVPDLGRVVPAAAGATAIAALVLVVAALAPAAAAMFGVGGALAAIAAMRVIAR